MHVVAPVATIILLIGLFCALGFLGESNIHTIKNTNAFLGAVLHHSET